MSYAAAAQQDSLSLAFKQPTANAKPMIWWFWGESTITEHGITKDLEALKSAGFGGVVLYEQVFKDDPDALKSLSPEWLSRVRFAAAECARLGMRLEINSSNGYVAGGPWITPELGMQRLVASETTVAGGRHLALQLEQPPTKLNYYKDVAVLAFPALKGQLLPAPVITSSPKVDDLAAMFNTAAPVRVRVKPAAGGKPTYIKLDYGSPVEVRSITYALRPSSKAYIIATQVPGNWSKDFYGENMKPILPIGELESSADSLHWEKIKQLPGRGYQFENWDRQTLAFKPVKARYFRLNLHDWGYNDRAKDADLLIGSVRLQGTAKIDQWEKKSGNTNDFPDPDLTPNYQAGEVIDPRKIVDLTHLIDATGHLEWTAPAGRWTIMRFGHTPTGVKTKHGRPEGLGLECDKLSAKATTVQFEHYVGTILKEVQRVPGAKVAGVNMDSAEHGTQNWTEDFAEQFRKLCGYDLRSYLPTMAGYVVDNPQVSERFLFDVRRTIANLMSDQYYGTFQQLCHANGMTFMAQAPGNATCMPSDNIRAKGRTDIPMAEFWMPEKEGSIECKEASSSAHIYGKSTVAAESFTGSKADVTLAQMKPLADAALAQGINRFVVLAYMHQPWDERKPGVTEDRFYLPYQRHNTWWQESTGFWNTLARSSQMMQTGKPVIDILYHLGNDTPLKIATARMRPVPPVGYDYDVCSDEILLRTTVKNGRIQLPSGMTYRLLILAGGKQLTLASLRHIHDLVKQGATILGQAKVNGSSSLADGKAADLQVRTITNTLWGAGNAKNGQTNLGAGRFIWGVSPAEALKRMQVLPDFEVASSAHADSILFNHRKAGQDEIYFIVNHAQQPLAFEGVFRTENLHPQLWNPEDGAMVGVKHYQEAKGQTTIPLRLESHESVFVVFRTKAVPAVEQPRLVEALPVWKDLSSDWLLRFTPGLGAPKEVSLSKLTSWTSAADSGVRHYAGTATYSRKFEVTSKPPGRIMLDLGSVKEVATIKVNGVPCAPIWKKPYAVDITEMIKQGNNDLEVAVTNTWANRLIGDAGLPLDKRISWATFNPYNPEDPLIASGLLGPVVLKTE
ncbi:glycosyl hydrolase [Hymenobacter sp. GOD-10R]|uniref:glycosyl hydrolase n=1 Tax=Hymenobacter sp. GOD-10R TaxID=3093922 RepID=UPI002D7A1015|nr:glycosyl hydrolase [Hymenobacter sp. GOD-10R]WRQ30645.1 glycosyl hydrolase [Hymenobacter sp. GOD-10R]